MADKPSEPFAMPPDAPKDFTLHKALQGTRTDDGHWHVGKLEFENRHEYLSFREAQNALGPNKAQLAILYQLETTGKNPGSQLIAEAPPLVTADQLLDLKGQQPDAHGFVHMGKLRVPANEYERFAAVQRDLCAKNPEAVAALYHMENGAKTTTFRVTPDSDRGDRFEPDKNTVYWNPHTSARDSRNGAAVDPATAALHEETHLLLETSRLGEVLAGIPNEKYTNLNEAAVIEGAEARQMDIEGKAKRISHHGSVLNVKELEDIKPSVTIRQNGVERDVGAPFKQSGKVVGISKDGEWVTVSTRGDGKEPAHQMDIKIDHIQGAFQSDAHAARVLLDGAQRHGDRISIAMTSDGRITYENPAQHDRIADRDLKNDEIRRDNAKHPDDPPKPLGEQWPPYPRTMPAYDSRGDRIPEPPIGRDAAPPAAAHAR